MKMHVKMTDTVPSLLDGMKSRFPAHKAISEICARGKALITSRTLSGKDVSNKPFDPYRTEPYYAPVQNRPPGYPTPSGGIMSGTRAARGKTMKFPSYAAYKAGLGFGPQPQLSISNQMLSDILWIPRTKTKAIMFFASTLSAAKAHRHHTGYYPFFGFGMKDIHEMNDELRFLFHKARKEARARLKAKRSRSK